ncbi:hypothetical protein [Mesorhizobium sp. ES1-4]|uniref:hypothetical protein n=1 Tax=Mesorhizobium sp. ES1-4 TaxID=2876627 RepID=UPI001CCD3E73|nr:hypothetical protein [Mesorhizobium sp. ES1-4]MBZ9795792.1 hypothetical protein [Mesorhizobium sp. ES1-4]
MPKRVTIKMIVVVRDKIFVPWHGYAEHVSSRSCRYPAIAAPGGVGRKRDQAEAVRGSGRWEARCR